MIRDLIIKTPYNPGERLPPEREIAEMLDVTRTVVREALIMLEIKGLVEVRRGAGIYVLDNSGSQNTDSPDANVCNDAGPFELLQARQLLRATSPSLPLCRLPAKISSKCVRHCNWKSVNWLPVRRAAAKAVTCSSISLLPKQRITACWWSCSVSPGSGGKTINVDQLHSHLDDSLYRKEWLGDHKQILAALIKKDARAAKLAMWQHLENVKQRLLEFSNVDDIYFDGYLFDSWPLDKVDA